MVVAMLYKEILQSPAIGVCFWYYCGVVAAGSRFPSKLSAAPSDTSERNQIEISDSQANGQQ
jgi:hypothetical protein